MMYIPTTIALLLPLAKAAALASFVPNFEEHFSTEAAVKRAPTFDLSAFGYHGGKLPRVYDIAGGRAAYSARRSFEHFGDILSGRANASDTMSRSMKRGLELETRDNQLHMSTVNQAGSGDDWNVAADESCKSGSNAPYVNVYVYHAGDVYVTFCDSDVCNGHKGSFNPSCNVDSGDGQACQLNFSPRSFSVYSGCHSDYSDDGCVT